MNYIIALGFDFSLEKLSHPVVIIGMILMVLSIFLIGAASKIDERIKAKRRSANIDTSASSDDNIKLEDKSGNISAESEDESGNINDSANLDESDSMSEELTSKEASRLQDNLEDENGELSMFRHKDGSINAYMVIKLVGLLLVVVSAIMIVAGM